MKKSIFLFFAAILCAMTANAYDQAAVDLYFDNSTSQWSECYVSVGHTSWTAFYDMERVSGTQYLWKLPANFNGGSAWGGAKGWAVSKDKWDGYPKSEDITVKYVWHGDKNVTKLQTTAWVNSKIYKANGTESVSKDNTTKTVYKVTSYTNSNYTVTINTVEGGTLTVKDYDNNAVATGASKIHLTVLKFSAAPASGYVLEGVQINDGSNTTTIAASEINTKTHTLTSNVTITPIWKATTSTVTVTAEATNGTVTGAGVYEEGTFVTLTATPDAGYQFKNWTVAGAEVSTANPYTFTVNEDVTVTANFEEIPKVTVYFVNNGGWSKINAYAWDGSKGANPGWPGADITANKLSEQIGGFDVYSYTVEQGSYGKVIFNNGSAQTADYVWTDGNYYWHNEAANFDGGTKAQAEEKFSVPVEYDYVYFINTNDWAAVKIYTWTPEIGGWPGVAMTKESEQIAGKDVYSYKAVKGTTFGGIKFSDNGGTQTGNLTWQAGKYYAPSKDKWYDTKEAAEAALAAPLADETVYFVNNKKWANVNIYGWGGTLTDGTGANKWPGVAMTKTEEQVAGFDVYSYTVKEGTLKNILFNYNGEDANKSADFVWTNGKYYYVGATANYAGGTKEEVADIVAVPVVDSYYVSGTFNGWASNDDAKLTLNGELYTKELTLEAGAHMFKVQKNNWEGDWGYSNVKGAYVGMEEGTNDNNEKNNNIKLTLTEKTTFTVKFNLAANEITFEGLTEMPKGWYIISNATDWEVITDGSQSLQPVAEGIYEIEIGFANAGVHELKVSNETKSETYGYSQITKKNYNELSQGEFDNIKLTFTEAFKTVTITFNSETKEITLSGDLTENVAPRTYTVTVPANTEKCYICGAWDWNTFMEMAPVAGEANKFTIDIVGATEAQEYKYTCGEGWEYAEVNADGTTRANRTYNANDVVEKWADVVTYVLMGVNGDWTTGIKMTVNPSNADEYMLLGQTINEKTDAVKVVTIINGEQKAWCGDLNEYSNAIPNYDGSGNLVLEGGVYDFYFNKNDSKIYIEQKVYTRNVTNTFGTICLPYASASTSGAYFFEAVGKGTENGKPAVYLASVSQLEAGVPYIFQKTASQIKVVYDMSAAAVKTAKTANGLVGSFEHDKIVPMNTGYILYNNAFCPSDGSAKVNAYRAYLNLNDVTGGKPTQMPGRRYIGMEVQDENEATGVEDLSTTDAPVKVIENGQLIIIRDGVKYNVQGQLVK